jgi:hypothetical protein
MDPPPHGNPAIPSPNRGGEGLSIPGANGLCTCRASAQPWHRVGMGVAAVALIALVG